MTRHIHRKVGQLLPELKEEDEGFYKILSANTANHLCQSCTHAANSYSLRTNNEHVVFPLLDCFCTWSAFCYTFLAPFGMQHITMFDLTLGLLMELVKANATAQCRTYLNTCEGMSKSGYEASARM